MENNLKIDSYVLNIYEMYLKTLWGPISVQSIDVLYIWKSAEYLTKHELIRNIDDFEVRCVFSNAN